MSNTATGITVGPVRYEGTCTGLNGCGKEISVTLRTSVDSHGTQEYRCACGQITSLEKDTEVANGDK